MSYSRFNIEKEQISTDRGITWTDVGETRQGKLVAVTRTLLECEDKACELEEDRYAIVEGSMPTEICGGLVLPEGIAKNIRFTAGAVCIDTWQWCNPESTDYISGDIVQHTLGHRVCGGGTCSFFYNSAFLNGMSVTGCCVNSYTCTCYQITEFMPWVDTDRIWRLIEKRHYVREHCTDDWTEQGEPQIVGIAERWKWMGDDFYSETWQHQVATGIDGNGNVTGWSNSGSSDVTYYSTYLPEGVEIISGIDADGTMYCTDGVFKEDLSIQVKTNGQSHSGTVLHSLYHYTNTNSGNSISVSENPPQTVGQNVWPINPTEEYKYFVNSKLSVGNVNANYGCLFGMVYARGNAGGYVSHVYELLDGVTTGLIRKGYEYMSAQDKMGTMFPYRLNHGGGQSYEYGYVLRNGTMHRLLIKEE